MPTEENKIIVRQLFDELFNKGNPAAANKLSHPIDLAGVMRQIQSA